jgi:hypothetical protein
MCSEKAAKVTTARPSNSSQKNDFLINIGISLTCHVNITRDSVLNDALNLGLLVKIGRQSISHRQTPQTSECNETYRTEHHSQFAYNVRVTLRRSGVIIRAVGYLIV